MGRRAVASRLRKDEEGQSTVEYLVVAVGVVAVVVALYALARAGERGILGRLAVGAASHAVGGTNVANALLDVFLF